MHEFARIAIAHGLNGNDPGLMRYAKAVVAASVQECEWHPIDDEAMPSTWEGSCMIMWSFIEEGPTENGVKFCPKCGGKVVINEVNHE